MTAIATIAPVNQTMDSATSTMMIEPNAPFLKPTVDPSISCGKPIFEPWTYFASARQILFNKIKSSANQSHGNRRSNMISNLATSVIGRTPDTPSQVCEGESVNQIPIGARETETVELEREQKAQSASNLISSRLLFRARLKPLRCSLRNANILASEGDNDTYGNSSRISHTFASEGDSISHTFASEGDTSAQHIRHHTDSTTTTHLL